MFKKYFEKLKDSKDIRVHIVVLTKSIEERTMMNVAIKLTDPNRFKYSWILIGENHMVEFNMPYNRYRQLIDIVQKLGWNFKYSETGTICELINTKEGA